jgi:16S rRNA (adenine(1408)-N(1))-methyltransferase
LAIAVDVNAASMGDAARRAERRKTALPNTLFVVAAAESLPRELEGIADLVTVLFPWSSLLRGVVTGNGPVIGSLASTCRQGGQLIAMWSLTSRDGRFSDLPADGDRAIYRAFERAGLRVVEHRAATPQEVAATHSSWARRLRAGRDRPVKLLRAVRS